MMESAVQAYRASIRPRFLREEIDLVLSSSDRETAVALQREGYSSQEIRAALFNLSPLAKDIRMKSASRHI